MNHCYVDSQTLPEPEWFVMVSVLSRFDEVGRKLIHEFSKDYPEYDYTETERKINYALGQKSPITCGHIRDVLKFDCGITCGHKGIHTPADLWLHIGSRNTKKALAFELRDDGVYYQADPDAMSTKLCSWIRVLARIRTPDNTGWARRVEIKSPDGTVRQLNLKMSDFSGRGESVIATLLDNGLEIEPYHKHPRLLLDYLTSNMVEGNFGLLVDKIGWLTEETYVLPDEQFGKKYDEEIYFEHTVATFFNQQGTLDEWKENVAQYCAGNSILLLSVCFAFVGPLLHLKRKEGFGLHIYGCSSSGKSSTALVAGSVCGGNGLRGFIRQWRSTHNALEHTATMHNDNLLVLDEISQASSETVSQVAYMLANGQGRERLKADASKRKTYTWLLNFLSTGELTIDDKIVETGKYKALAGQSVRIIDLPIDEGTGANAFPNLHEFATAKEFIDTVTGNAKQYYGTAIREFLRRLCDDIQGSIPAINASMNAFIGDNTPADASGQVLRVLSNFALIEAAGRLAVKYDVLPFCEDEITQTVKKWFGVWLKQRNGIADKELLQVLRRIKRFFAEHSHEFIKLPIKLPTFANEVIQHGKLYGCIVEPSGHNDKPLYFTLNHVLDDLFQGVNKRFVLLELQKRGWILKRPHRELTEVRKIVGHTYRGICFIPSAWEKDTDF